jgi:serine/threonine protein kinase
MAPERVFDQPYDGRADVYSVGVMLYEMVAGQLPFETTAGGHLSLMRMHVMDKPLPLSRVFPDAHPKLEVAVVSAMRKEPEERPTAAQLGSMLRDLLVEMRGPNRYRRPSDSYRA